MNTDISNMLNECTQKINEGNTILTCCELPTCMQDKDLEVNDYDFVLYHQYLKNETYRKTYLDRGMEYPERMMILDNSAYEFFVSGEEFNEEDYMRVINELKPDIYIVPDTLMDSRDTLSKSAHWLTTHLAEVMGSGAVPMMTPQGKTKEEFMECIEVMTEWINRSGLPKCLCIPFHDEFLKMGPVPVNIVDEVYPNGGEITIDRKYALGRVMLMNELCEKYPDYKFHLLGSHDPAELRAHIRHRQIVSMDSGYPVKLGIVGVTMGEEKEKPNIIIDEFCDKELNEDTIQLILNNIKVMKNYAK